MKTVWMVVRYWPGGKRVVVAAFLDEQEARLSASREVGKDGALIALETIPLQDGESGESDHAR